MGLFSSKSSSTSTTYNQSAQSSGTIGDLSSGNTIIGGDYNPNGLSDDNLAMVLGQNQNLLEKTISTVQNTAEIAINTAASAYADATGTTKNLFEGMKPLAMYAAIALVAYALLKGK